MRMMCLYDEFIIHHTSDLSKSFRHALSAKSEQTPPCVFTPDAHVKRKSLAVGWQDSPTHHHCSGLDLMNVRFISVGCIAATLAISACAAENALYRASDACNKLPSSEARADCEKKHREAQDAWNKDMQDKARKSKPDLASPAPKKDDLCFTRSSTGERVCPN